MAENNLVLTADEQEYLINLLQTTLKSTRIEEHRTRRPTYRQLVVHEEELLESVLAKLGRPVE